MFPSRFSTVEVPIIATLLAGQVPRSPAIVVENAGFDMIVRVRNNSFGQFVLLALDPSVLQTTPARADTFKLPAGAVENVILAKGQSLYASTPSGAADGAGAEISYHIYESVPIDDKD